MGVDIHNHLVPGIDDGMPDARQSVQVIRSFLDLGLSKIICTPHIFDEVYPNTPQTIQTALDTLQAALDREGLTVPVSASAEYMLGEEFRQKMQRGEMRPFPDNYLLVEMPYTTEPMQLENLIFDIELHGFKPILAHPERYIFYYDRPDRFNKLKELGCLFQLNILSPTGYYNDRCKQIALKLLKQNAYDLIGTDLHHERHLNQLTRFVQKGHAGELLGNYPFKNRELFW